LVRLIFSYTFFWLIIPSIPGYGFSEAAHLPGLGTVEVAQIFHKLMKRLGFSQYYAQGGDWGDNLLIMNLFIFTKDLSESVRVLQSDVRVWVSLLQDP
jgi:hypothetical protein